MVEDGHRRDRRGDARCARQRLDAAGRTNRASQRASRSSPQRTAVDAAHFSRCDMVMLAEREADLRRRAWDAAAGVVDPEIPVLTIADLGVLRELSLRDDGSVEVTITPTYSGCPAMSTIAFDIRVALDRAGFRDAAVRTVLSPAWTTDWMSED